MFSFIRNCACFGRKPNHLAMARCRQRAQLTALMLRERSVARFIVAPDGFGKTAAALEYADVVFGFEHVFWIRCTSPCFLRDLDAGRIVDAIDAADPEGALVVLEDVPRFEDDRRTRFSALIDALLSSGREVIVTCAPSCDSYADLQQDRICIDSDMLLVSDDELAIEGTRKLADDQAPSCRTPCMVWSKEGPRQLISGLRREELPSDVVVGVLTLLMLGRGSFEDLTAVTGEQWASRIVEELAVSYPYVGINVDDSSFFATPIAVEALASGFSRGLASLVSACPISDRDQLISRIADILLLREQTERACEIVRSFSSPKGVSRWLFERGPELLERGAFASVLALHRHIERRRQEKHPDNDSAALIAAMVIGDDDRAIALSKRILGSKTSGVPHHCIALIAQLHLTSWEERDHWRAQVCDNLDRLNAASPIDPETSRWNGDEERRVLLALYACVSADPKEQWDEFLRCWDGQLHHLSVLARASALVRILAMVCAPRPRGAHAEKTDDAMASRPSSLFRLAELMTDIIDDLEAEVRAGTINAVEAMTAEALFNAMRLLPEEARPPISEWLREQTTALRLQVMRMRKAYTREKQREWEESSATDSEAGGLSLHPTKVGIVDHAPIMDVTLFGGFNVKIGNRSFGIADLTRQKSRQLLALLVLHHGHEVPRDRLAEMLWPESDDISSCKSLYSAWSKLRKTIAPDGACPYLIRSQSGFRLTPELVDSDVYRFEEFCRSLMFAGKMPIDWQEAFRRVTEDFCEDLLPSEKDSPVIEIARNRYRSQLVDSLVYVSGRLEQSRESQGAIWFAREAIERDPSREDAHIALMRAQISANQRSSALETYFNCRSYLAENLGIDPSPTIVNLYRSIIEEEVIV